MTIPANIARPATRNDAWVTLMRTMLGQRADVLVNLPEPTETNFQGWADAVTAMIEALNHVHLARQLSRPSTVSPGAWEALEVAWDRAYGIYSEQLVEAGRVSTAASDGTLLPPLRRTSSDVMDFSLPETPVAPAGPAPGRPPPSPLWGRPSGTGGGAKPGQVPGGGGTTGTSSVTPLLIVGGIVVVGGLIMWALSGEKR